MSKQSMPSDHLTAYKRGTETAARGERGINPYQWQPGPCLAQSFAHGYTDEILRQIACEKKPPQGRES